VREGRHKGRIERLRVRLAYGFEARTQHQLSSSWHAREGGGYGRDDTMQGRSGDIVHIQTHARTRVHTNKHTACRGRWGRRRAQPKGDSMFVVAFH
jgi:hypothetical protein